MNININDDGITHINVYSKGKTELGRFASNFAHTPFDCEDGHFESIEGLWYYLFGKSLNLECEELRNLFGWQAKQFGKNLCGRYRLKDDFLFREKICKAIKIKFENNKEMFQKLKENKLPLKHYYVYDDLIVEPKDNRWVIEYLEFLAKE